MQIEIFMISSGDDPSWRQSIDTPLALIGAAHFLISLTTNSARYSVLRRSGGATRSPVLSSRRRTSGVSSASLSARLSRLTIVLGVALGRNRANHNGASKSATPCSLAVGGLGNTGERSR